MMSTLNEIYKHPKRAAKYAFVAFSVMWTLTAALTHFEPRVNITGCWALGGVFIISIFYVLTRIRKLSCVSIKIANANSTIDVLFGDLFLQEGIRAINANEFFDSQLGKPVSEKSVHGLFIKKYFRDHPEYFDKQVSSELQGIQSEHVERSEGKTERYPIGSSALVTTNGDKYLVFAFAKTNPVTSKAYCDVGIMWTALIQLWQRARIEAGGYPLNLPLVGSGLSGVGLPVRDLLNLMILSAITETKKSQVTRRIRIILHDDLFEEIDLREIKQHWER